MALEAFLFISFPILQILFFLVNFDSEKFDNLRLESHRQGRFLDAEAAKNKLKKLNDALDKVKKKEMKGKHHLEVRLHSPLHQNRN